MDHPADFDVIEQRHQLEQLARHIPMAVAILDTDLRYLFTNDRWISDFGLEDRSIIGTRHYDLFRDVSDDWKDIHQRCLQGEVHRDEQVPLIQNDGTLEWLKREIRPWYVTSGEIGGLIIYAEFITDRVHAQEALQDQRNFLRQVIDLDPSFIFAKDESGRFLLVNKALADTYGTAPDEMVGKYDEDFNPKRSETEHFRRDDNEVVHARQPKFIPEEPVSNAVTGETRWYQTIKVPLIAADGQTVQLLGIATDITERKLAQDRLETQHNFLRQVIDLNTSFIFAKDEHGRFMLVNKALADTYGTTPDAIVGKLDKDFNPSLAESEHFHRDDLEVVRTRQPKFIAEEPLSNAVTGETRWYQTIKVPLIAADGQTVQLLGVATDITERKRAQDRLKDQRNFLRQVIDLDPSFIFAKDEHGRFMLVNKALADAYNSKPDEMVGKLDEDFNPNRVESDHLHRDDLEVVRTRQPKFIAEEPISNVLTGETRWYQTIKVPLIAADGHTMQLLGVATDITDRKRAQDNLEAQRNFLRQVIDLDPNFIFAKDEQGCFILVNKALAEMYGTAPDTMVGKLDEDFNPNRVETEHFRLDDIAVLRTRQPQFIAEEAMTNVVTGETRWYQTTKVPLMASDGQAGQLLGIATDITDRKRAQERLQELVIHEQKARREAETATRLKDLFLANMSHELRTPLNAIIGFLREMLYSRQLNEDNTHMAERCLANGQRLLLLINSVLDLSRLATGSLEIVLSDISLRILAATIVEDLQLQAKDKGLQLDLILDPALPEVVTHDEERLIQITTNLVANAIKFTNEGYITLELKRQADRLNICVADTGIGIPSSMQKIIFDDFVQLDSSSKRRYGGAGLGLSIVNNLVELMGGSVTVDSEVGKYSIFTVDVPLELHAVSGLKG